MTGSWGQGVPLVTGAVQGTVVDDSGAALANAKVLLRAVDPSSRFTANTVTSSIGAFNMKAIPAGRYVLCARPASSGHMDSCLWGMPRSIVDVPAGVATRSVVVGLKKTLLFKVRLNDSASFLKPLPTEKFPPHVVVGVWAASRFLPAHEVGKDAAGVDYELAVPFDTPLRFKVYSRYVKLLLTGNTAVAPQGYSTVLFFDSKKAVPPPLVLAAVGRLP